jgi:cobyrinic acid a,c-diamide synthase
MSRGIMIAGTHSGSGKTTISLGIMGVLSKKYKVVPFKIGPEHAPRILDQSKITVQVLGKVVRAIIAF